MRAVRPWLPPIVSYLLIGLVAGSFFLVGDQPVDTIHVFHPGHQQIRSDSSMQAFKPVMPLDVDYSERIALATLRPLFSETRRLPPSKSDVAASPDLNNPEVQNISDMSDKKSADTKQVNRLAPEISFRGFIQNGGKTMALLRHSEPAEDIWVRKNDQILGWHVRSISEREVMLVSNGIEHVIQKAK